MSLNYRVVPMRPWPDATPESSRDYCRFTASWSQTLDLLGREVDALAGRNVVLQLDVRDRDIRNDGGVRADTRIDFPGARLSFDSKHGPLTYGTDTFRGGSVYSRGTVRTIPGWQNNVRAIALALEALRKVDRYGISRRGEQYQGWKQLEAGPSAIAVGGMDAVEAQEVLLVAAARGGYETDGDLNWLAVARAAKAAAHPDRNGGDRTLWDRVETAARVLGADR